MTLSSPIVFLSRTTPTLLSAWRWHATTCRLCKHSFAGSGAYVRVDCSPDLVLHLACLEKFAKSAKWKSNGANVVKSEWVDRPDCEHPLTRRHLQAKVFMKAKREIPLWPKGLRVDLQRLECVPVCCERDDEGTAALPGSCECNKSHASAQVGSQAFVESTSSCDESETLSAEYSEESAKEGLEDEIFAHGNFKVGPAYIYEWRFSGKGMLRKVLPHWALGRKT